MLDTTTIYNFTILAQFRSIPHDIEHVPKNPQNFSVGDDNLKGIYIAFAKMYNRRTNLRTFEERKRLFQ